MSGAGETDLAVLLASMSPELHDGSYVFVVDEGRGGREEAVVVVAEAEGTTLVLPRERADELGLTYAFVASWITLRVHSALDAVGLTAAFARGAHRRGHQRERGRGVLPRPPVRPRGPPRRRDAGAAGPGEESGRLT